MRRTTALRGPGALVCFSLLTASTLSTTPTAAADCASAAGLSACFDANSLWLPAGAAAFFSLPDTRTTAVGQVGFGVATEVLHRPVLLHAESPDQEGRDIHVLDYAVDGSFFLAFGLRRNLELTLTAPTRVYQTGAGSGSVTRQSSPPIERSAVRNPRLGIAYSLDETLATRGLGVRLALEASLPLGEVGAFAGEHSLVAMPNATVSWRRAALSLSASLGARLRNAVDFAGTRLGNQGFVALGMGVEALQPDLLFLSLEAFGFPALSETRTSTSSPRLSDARLFPAEWLASVHSSFGTRGQWTLSLAAGTGLPLSSETRQAANGPVTSYFLGLTTPDFRSSLVVRYAPPVRH